jgi:hypothetical protein
VARLLRRTLLVALPFLALAAAVVCIDPFDFFRYVSVVPDTTKYRTVHGVNPVLWDTFSYYHDPRPNVVIGDSRAQLVSLDHLKARTGKDHRLLSATAAKLNEIVDYFWFADSRTKLSSVYIVLNFNMFNYYAFADRVAGATASIRNPLLYVFNQSVLESTWEVAKAASLRQGVGPAAEAMSKDQKWAWTLSTWAPQQYGKWKYPEREYHRLKEVGQFCRKQAIDLVIIIAPHHVEYQQKVLEFGLVEQAEQFKRDIAEVARTYDFDYVNELTSSRDNFADPVHVTQQVSNSMMDEVLSGKLRYARLLGASDTPGPSPAVAGLRDSERR